MNRRGFTLAETVVVVVLGTAVAALMFATLVRQQRFYTSAAAILDVRGQLRDATEVVAGDLRGAAVGTFGLPVMTDSAVEMYASVASSVICSPLSAMSFSIPPVLLASGNTLTSVLVQPDTGDIALIYGIPGSESDSGGWEPAGIASFISRPASAYCPDSTGFTTPADASTGSPAFVATLAGTPSTPLRKGAPVHFLRRSRYSLYRSSDGKWYLGYRRCKVAGPPSCAAIQPVSGPYDAYSSSVPAGLAFRYYDVNGEALMQQSDSRRVARVEIVVRGSAAGVSRLHGDARAAYRDSAVITVGLRNR
ncbi:MAG: hypothetical protein ACSLFK_07075 [Gemmatimonadaceae bacterium]